MKLRTDFPLTVRVDYRQPIKEAIKAGKYDWSNVDICSQNFPVDPKLAKLGVVEMEIVPVEFEAYVESEEAISSLNKWFRVCVLHEQLAVGAQFPDLQREHRLVALGSVWRGPGGDRYVPCLWGGGSFRDLGLGWFGGGWFQGFRFLAVRK